MTRDIIVVSDNNKDGFAKEVFNQVSFQENQGYTCEIKFSTVENEHAWGNVKYSALIHVYDAE